MKLRKFLMKVLVVLLIISAGIAVYQITKDIIRDEDVISRNIVVANLKDADEQSLGTIIYSGATKLGPISQTGNVKTILLGSKDSVAGTAHIYYQDLLNRYKNNDVIKKQITFDGALDKEATEISSVTPIGKITVTIWQTEAGVTQIEIKNDGDYHL